MKKGVYSFAGMNIAYNYKFSVLSTEILVYFTYEISKAFWKLLWTTHKRTQ